VAEHRQHPLVDLVEKCRCPVANASLAQDVTVEARILAFAIAVAQSR
jgi:hypothetical protein